jgi:predicted XRE-type DNA-binding protein
MSPWVDPVPALKRQLADEVLARTEGQSQVWAAWAARLSRARVSEMRRGRLDNVSLEALVRSLYYLGRDIEITTKRRVRGR